MSATSTKSQKKQYKALCTAAVVRPPWLRSDMFKFLDDYKGRITVSWEVALFEADAQIGHLLTLGLYQFAIAEDQDLVLYGANMVMFKLGYAGFKNNKYRVDQCDWLDLSKWSTGRLPMCGQQSCTKKKSCPTCGCTVGLTHQGILQACILAGTDYCPGGMDRIGLSTACDLMRKHQTLNAVLNQLILV